MKKTSPAENLPSKNVPSIFELQKQIDAYEKERNVLMALSNDIIKVREKEDLVSIFSRHFQNLFYFTHARITLIDDIEENYFSFLLDSESVKLKSHGSK